MRPLRTVLSALLPLLAFLGLLALAPQAQAQSTVYKQNTPFTTGQFGTLVLGVRNDAGATLCNSAGFFCTFTFDATGALRISGAVSTGGGVATANNPGACVSVTTASGTVLASFPTRRWATLVNQGTATVFIKFGAVATAANLPLLAGAAFNWPASVSYTGVVDAISSSGTNSVCVSEW